VIDSRSFAAAVEVGIAAFCAGEEPPDNDEIWDRLTEKGVEPWLAERLLVFLPMAYTRYWWSQVSFSDELAAPGGQLTLSSEPVFVAALARARHGRAELERIAPYSAEFKGITQALNAGAELSDLVAGELALADNLPTVRPGDGGVPDPRAVFEDLLKEHGVSLGDGEIAVNARLSPRPASVPGMVMAQIYFEVSHPALAAPLTDSSSWPAPTWGDAIGAAVIRFAHLILHPLVNGLLRPGASADQVQRKEYAHPEGSFTAVVGATVTMFADRAVPPAGPLLDRLLEALRTEPLTRKVHTLSLLIAHTEGVLQTGEVILDDIPWPAGQAIVADAPAPFPHGVTAYRVFSLLVPSDGGA
jgi:hypothetical protein